jgi:uncharacterized BrkB/YihY/UPF0761 family membrane protein
MGAAMFAKAYEPTGTAATTVQAPRVTEFAAALNFPMLTNLKPIVLFSFDIFSFSH